VGNHVPQNHEFWGNQLMQANGGDHVIQRLQENIGLLQVNFFQFFPLHTFYQLSKTINDASGRMKKAYTNIIEAAETCAKKIASNRTPKQRNLLQIGALLFLNQVRNESKTDFISFPCLGACFVAKLLDLRPQGKQLTPTQR